MNKYYILIIVYDNFFTKNVIIYWIGLNYYIEDIREKLKNGKFENQLLEWKKNTEISRRGVSSAVEQLTADQ